MPDIRPYELISRQVPTQGPSPRVNAGTGFSGYLDQELLGAAEELDARGEAEELDYLAAELACRRGLLTPTGTEGSQPYPVQTAYFLRNQNRPVDSPMRSLRLGGMMKAATMQFRNGLPATGTM